MEEGHEVGTAGGSGHDAVKHWLRPFQGVMKALHHWRSSWKGSESGMAAWRESAVVLRSIILRRKVRPAGTTLAAKLKVAMRDKSSCLVLCGRESVERRFEAGRGMWGL